MRQKYSVYLADDHEVHRMGVASVLRACHYRVADQFDDIGQLMDALKRQTPDALVIDLLLPGSGLFSGLDFPTGVASSFPRLPVLVLTTPHEPLDLQRLWNRSIRGLVDKTALLQDIPEALKRLTEGHEYVSDSLLPHLHIGVCAGSGVAEAGLLSARENLVLRRLGDGHSLTVVAALLDLSFSTVSTLKRRAMGQLRLRDNDALAKYLAAVGQSERAPWSQ